VAPHSSFLVLVLLASACSSVPPLVGKYECVRAGRSEEGESQTWTYELELSEDGVCWIMPHLHGAVGGGGVCSRRWELHHPKHGRETVTVLGDVFPQRLDLAIIDSDDELMLVSSDREWRFRKVPNYTSSAWTLMSR